MSKRDREKRKQRVARDRIIQREKMEELDAMDDLETPIEEPEVTTEDVTEKEYDDDAEVGIYTGPTSWDELDAMQEAQEKANKVRWETYNVQDLVRNIVYTPMMTPEQKGNAIESVGKGFSQRVKSIMSNSKKMEKEYDIELLELQALIAKDRRHTPFTEVVGEWITKKKLTASAESKLSDDDFALVVEREGKKVRKYPIHDKAHVRNALARAAQMMKDGGEAATDAKAALPKIRAAAKKMGIGQMEKSSSSIIVEKDASGRWRAVMWPTNNFMDRDGEILSEKAHLEYVDWVNKNMHLAPVMTTWHKPQLVRKNQVDFVGYENGFIIMSAPLEEEEAAGLFRVMQKCDVGMSHGTLALERNEETPNVIEKYRIIEVSDLPLENAANPFTDFSVISKEADMNTRDYIASLLGEQKADEILAKTELKQKALREAGVTEKEKQEETPVVPATPAPEEKPLPANMQEIVEAISKELDVEGLNKFVIEAKEAMEKVPVLENIIKELSANRDDELAEMIAPKIEKHLAWSSKRPSQSDANVLVEKNDKDEKLKKSAVMGWFSEATNTQPVVTES